MYLLQGDVPLRTGACRLGRYRPSWDARVCVCMYVLVCAE